MRFSMRLIVAGLVGFVCREQPDPLLLLLCSLPQRWRHPSCYGRGAIA